MNQHKANQTGGYLSKLVPEKAVPDYLAKGYKIIDPHLHTSCSSDVLPAQSVAPEHLYNKMKAEGWDYITFTDHDTMDAYDELAEGLPGLVRGVEIKIKPKTIGGSNNTHTIHVNVYELSNSHFNELEARAKQGDFYGFIDYLKKEELPYMLNHPTWPEAREKPDWKLLPQIIKEFDVIEAYNQGRIEKQNLITLRLAEQYSKGIVSSSDNHRGHPIKSTLAKGESFRECWENIKQGNSLIVPHSLDYGFIQAEVNGWIKQFIEASREKLKEKNYSMGTGVKSLDNFIDLITNRKISHFRPVRRANALAISALFGLLGYHIAHSAYINPQHRNAEQIIQTIESLDDKIKLDDRIDFLSQDWPLQNNPVSL
ncbi:PHP domain-containing protein [Candidatus Woesearchaeota archaeon]|nr:PHP domain-containing protein [Candidatus Woesearchaeota archaeon]